MKRAEELALAVLQYADAVLGTARSYDGLDELCELAEAALEELEEAEVKVG